MKYLLGITLWLSVIVHTVAQEKTDIIVGSNYLYDFYKLSSDNKYFITSDYYDCKVGLLVNSDLVYQYKIENYSNKIVACDFLSDSKHIVIVDSSKILISNIITQNIVETIPFDLKKNSFGCVFWPESNRIYEVFYKPKTNLIYCRYFDINTKSFSKEKLIFKTEKIIKEGRISFTDDKRQNFLIIVNEEFDRYSEWKERQEKGMNDVFYNPLFDYNKSEGFRFVFDENYLDEYFVFNSKFEELTKIKHTEVLITHIYEAPELYFEFSPDGRYLTYANKYQKTLVYECSTGEIIKHFKNIICTTVTKDNKYLIGKNVNSTISNELQLFSFETGSLVSKFRTQNSLSHFKKRTFLNNDFLIISTEQLNEIFDTKTQKKIHEKKFNLIKEISNTNNDFKTKITEKNLYVNAEKLKIINLNDLTIKTISSSKINYFSNFFISDDETLYFNGREIWNIENGKLLKKYDFLPDKRKLSILDYSTNSNFDYFSLIYGYRKLNERSIEGNPLEDLTLVLFNVKGEIIYKKNYGETSDFFFHII